MLTSKERFDKIVSEKEVEDKSHYMKLLPKLCDLLEKEDSYLENLLIKLSGAKLEKEEKLPSLLRYYKENLYDEKKVYHVEDYFNHENAIPDIYLKEMER